MMQQIQSKLSELVKQISSNAQLGEQLNDEFLTKKGMDNLEAITFKLQKQLDEFKIETDSLRQQVDQKEAKIGELNNEINQLKEQNKDLARRIQKQFGRVGHFL